MQSPSTNPHDMISCWSRRMHGEITDLLCCQIYICHMLFRYATRNRTTNTYTLLPASLVLRRCLFSIFDRRSSTCRISSPPLLRSIYHTKYSLSAFLTTVVLLAVTFSRWQPVTNPRTSNLLFALPSHHVSKCFIKPVVVSNVYPMYSMILYFKPHHPITSLSCTVLRSRPYRDHRQHGQQHPVRFNRRRLNRRLQRGHRGCHRHLRGGRVRRQPGGLRGS